MFKVELEVDKIQDAMDLINTVAYTLNTNAHINDLITAANRIIASEFIIHMSQEAFNSPKTFEHMYEWGRVGDPNARLWKHLLRGSGSGRIATFDFKASKTSVPVRPPKAAVGVQQNHIFVWKAPVLELGLPVRISPKIANTLVYDIKGTDSLVYTKRTIFIPRQGNPEVWGAFTNEYMRWWGGPMPGQIIRTQLEPKIDRGIKQAMAVGIRRINKKKSKKTLTIRPMGIDKNFVTTINNSLRTNYIDAARNRRVDD